MKDLKQDSIWYISETWNFVHCDLYTMYIIQAQYKYNTYKYKLELIEKNIFFKIVTNSLIQLDDVSIFF